MDSCAVQILQFSFRWQYNHQQPLLHGLKVKQPETMVGEGNIPKENNSKEIGLSTETFEDFNCTSDNN